MPNSPEERSGTKRTARRTSESAPEQPVEVKLGSSAGCQCGRCCGEGGGGATSANERHRQEWRHSGSQHDDDDEVKHDYADNVAASRASPMKRRRRHHRRSSRVRTTTTTTTTTGAQSASFVERGEEEATVSSSEAIVEVLEADHVSGNSRGQQEEDRDSLKPEQQQQPKPQLQVVRPTEVEADAEEESLATVGRRRVERQPELQSDCDYTTGENSRCNCSGRRQATLAGLIELFEQKVRLNDSCRANEAPKGASAAGSGGNRPAPTRASEISCPTTSSHRRQQQQRGSALGTRSWRRIDKQQLSFRRNKINKQQASSGSGEMRNIVTPVKYSATESSNDDQNDGSLSGGDATDDWLSASNRARSKLHHVAAKGVPVLPRPDLQRKLTQTNWQPPTNDRRYERELLSRPSSSTRAAVSSGRSSRQREVGANGSDLAIECALDCEECRRQQAVREETRLNSLASGKRGRRGSFNSREKTPPSQPNLSRSPGLRGAPVVKHQPSNSRRLLKQLARLRRLSEPNYRVRRPEKVAQVEQLIEQLERATAQWEEDEGLLDRAERRDWPAEYHQRFPKQATDIDNEPSRQQQKQQQRVKVHSANEDGASGVDADFGCRIDVEPLEAATIARSHSNIFTRQPQRQEQVMMMLEDDDEDGVPFRAAGAWSASSTLTRKPSRRRREMLTRQAFADRYFDDLAVRRLSQARSWSANSSCQFIQSPVTPTMTIQDGQQQHDETTSEPGQLPQMSYLLCSNAYTPARDNLASLFYWDSLERRVRSDDLHYRSVKSRLAPHEPPFGIPRQQAAASTHSSASHYLRRQQSGRWPADQQRQPQTNSAISTADQRGNRQQQQQAMVCACANHANCLDNEREAAAAATIAETNLGDTDQQRCDLQKRSESKVSFVEALDPRATSADSGFVVGGSPSSAGRQSASSRLTPQSQVSGTLRRSKVLADLTADRDNEQRQQPDSIEAVGGRRHQHFDDSEDDVAQEVDLDEELLRRQEQRVDRWPSPVESPALECHLAELRLTPTRRRPLINIENPRAKSPLLRVATPNPTTSNVTWTSDKQLELDAETTPTRAMSSLAASSAREAKTHFSSQDADLNINRPPATSQIVRVECYSDSLKRRRSKSSLASRLVGELECQYDFGEEDEEDDFGTEKIGGRIVSTVLPEDSDSSLNQSSIERFDYRRHSFKGNQKGPEQLESELRYNKNDDTRSPKMTGDNKKPFFSIGEYKPLNKPGGLKIL